MADDAFPDSIEYIEVMHIRSLRIISDISISIEYDIYEISEFKLNIYIYRS